MHLQGRTETAWKSLICIKKMYKLSCCLLCKLLLIHLFRLIFYTLHVYNSCCNHKFCYFTCTLRFIIPLSEHWSLFPECVPLSRTSNNWLLTIWSSVSIICEHVTLPLLTHRHTKTLFLYMLPLHSYLHLYNILFCNSVLTSVSLRHLVRPIAGFHVFILDFWLPNTVFLPIVSH